MALWFFQRSGSRVSIHNRVTAESVLRAPPVSGLTLCPLGQPEKAIGLESQIEPWLALRPPRCLPASETKSVVAPRNEFANKNDLHSLSPSRWRDASTKAH